MGQRTHSFFIVCAGLRAGLIPTDDQLLSPARRVCFMGGESSRGRYTGGLLKPWRLGAIWGVCRQIGVPRTLCSERPRRLGRFLGWGRREWRLSTQSGHRGGQFTSTHSELVYSVSHVGEISTLACKLLYERSLSTSGCAAYCPPSKADKSALSNPFFSRTSGGSKGC